MRSFYLWEDVEFACVGQYTYDISESVVDVGHVCSSGEENVDRVYSRCLIVLISKGYIVACTTSICYGSYVYFRYRM